jgi:hypothetical protein
MVSGRNIGVNHFNTGQSTRFLFLSKYVLVILLLTWSQFAFCQPKDTLYFYNKTKIVGELLKIRLGRVDFDADGISILNIKNTKIESMHAASRSFRIETIEGEVLQGYLTRSQTSGMVVINDTIHSEEIYVDNITNLTWYGNSWKSRISGNVSAGYTYTKSSQIGRLNADGTLKYNTAKTQTQLQGDMIITTDSVVVVLERANLVLSHDYSFANLWAAVAVLKYQRNLELGLDRRWQEAFGLGRRFIISKSQQASAVTGVALNQEKNQEGVQATNTEALIQVNYNLYSFVSPNLTVAFVQSMYLGLTETDRMRLDGNISFDYELIKDFYLNLQFYHNYDSRSPATNEPNIDYGFVAGLRYKF